MALARACAAGDPEAQATMRARYAAEVSAIARRMGADPATAADIEQQVWSKMLVAVPPERPKIATYTGSGSLRSWVRMVATRATLAGLRARGQPAENIEDRLGQILASSQTDPELEYLKRLYSAEFQEAFRAAVATLTVRERNLLRQYFVSNLSIDELAPLYGIHRVTALRQVQRARQSLIAATWAALSDRLRISSASVESIMRLIESRIELDVGAL